jgi:LysM repeat protein
MKYRLLLRFLRVLIFVKRAFWWTGARMYFVFKKIFKKIAHALVWVKYKIYFFFKRLGPVRNWLFKRNFLQFIIFGILAVVALPQTTLGSNKNLAFSGQRTQAYHLLGSDEEAEIEEVASETVFMKQDVPTYRAGAIEKQIYGTGVSDLPRPTAELSTIVAGGTALTKPAILPGVIVTERRQGVVEYTVEPGDVLGLIAEAFDVSVATIMWENNLTLRSIIRPGDVLKIPPTTGVIHTIKKGDTIKKIATTYGADQSKIITYNKLKDDGSDLAVGERIVIPDGVKPSAVVTHTTVRTIATRVATPAASRAAPSSLGFVWPSGARMITQYFGVRHHALDIAGPWQTPTYAAKAGVVEKAQCGWNSGYGCYVIIDHGDGLKTLYGHHSKLLVSPGEYVATGQTIALMGNTGKVRGVTGIHLHFELIRSGVRVNPLGYVR